MRNSLSSSIRRVNVLYWRWRTWYQSIRNRIDLTVVVGTRRRLPSLENILLFIINYYIVLWALEIEIKKKTICGTTCSVYTNIYIFFCFRSETKARPKLYTVEGLVFLQRIFSFEGDTCHMRHTPHCSIILLIIYRQYDLYSDSYIYIYMGNKTMILKLIFI